MSGLGFILLKFNAFHAIVYTLIVLLILMAFAVVYIIRKGLIDRFIQKAKTKQIEQFRNETEKQLYKINSELKTNTIQIDETLHVIKVMGEKLNHLEKIIYSSNQMDKAERNEIISKVEQSVASNSAFNRKILNKIEKSMIQMHELSPIKRSLSSSNIDPSVTNGTKLDEDKKIASDQAGDIIYYLPFPDSKGFFWDDNKHMEIKNNSAFIMNLIKNNPNRAYFSLLTNNEKIIKNALLNPNAFLKPVCTISGNLSGHTIKVVNKGALELQNNKWMVLEGKKVEIQISY